MLQPNSNHLRNCGIFKKRRTRSGEDITAVLWGELNCGYHAADGYDIIVLIYIYAHYCHRYAQ